MTEAVYFIRCAGKVKVGFSRNVAGRVRDIAAGLFDPVELIGCVSGGRQLEQSIHERLAPHWVKGEWFTDNEEVRSLIAEVMDSGALPTPTIPTRPNRVAEGDVCPWLRMQSEIARTIACITTDLKDSLRARALGRQAGCDSATYQRALTLLKDTSERFGIVVDDAFDRDDYDDEALVTSVSEFVRERCDRAKALVTDPNK